MPVISPRRSSTSGSSSLYGTTTSTRATGGDSSSATSSSLSTGTNRYSSYYERAGSLSKLGSSSASSYTPGSYTSSYLGSYSSSSYVPRTSAYRSTSSASSYLSGGSALDNYRRTSTYFDNNDSTSYSRYGLRKPKTNIDDSKNDSTTTTTTSGVVRRSETKKPPTGASSSNSDKRLSSSCSSSSLARLVATSGLDIYEKYSPAHYKPSTELSRSRSAINETSVATAADAVNNDDNQHKDQTTERERRRNEAYAVATVTLDRPRSSRYSRLYSNDNNDNVGEDTIDNSTATATISTRKKRSSNNSTTSNDNNNNIPTATFTLRSSSQRASLKTKSAKQNDEKNNNNNNNIDITNNEITKTLKKSSSTKSTYKDDNNNNLRNGIIITKPTEICNGVITDGDGDLAITTKSKLKLSNSTSALNSENENDLGIARSASDSGGNFGGSSSVGFSIGGGGGGGSGAGSSGDVSTIPSFNLEVPSLNASTSSVASKSKIRSAVTTKSALPPASPTASRYWDRDNSRISSLSTLSSAGHNNLDADKASHDEKSEGLCGLRNIGNTCFMNSIIQCLSHTSELTKFLRNYNSSKSSSSSTKDQQILQEFSKLIREMWTNNVHSVTPMDLKRAFSTKHRMYSDYNQQDAQEFLRFFLDSLHSALNTGVKGEPLKIDDNLSDNKKAELTWDWYTRYENSLIRDLFVGQLKSTLRCTACGNASVTFDPFWDLSVSLPSSSRCKLDACLDLFIREEVLDGDEMPTCSRCKTRRKCTKSFSIQRFPKYLVIHLKRFSETRWSKLSSIVEFPTSERELNMGPYGANPNANIYYSLYAISNHMGSTAGGHYVALCKHPVSKKWHEFNDNMVSDPLSESHLVTSSAYILFYERA